MSSDLHYRSKSVSTLLMERRLSPKEARSENGIKVAKSIDAKIEHLSELLKCSKRDLVEIGFMRLYEEYLSEKDWYEIASE